MRLSFAILLFLVGSFVFSCGPAPGQQQGLQQPGIAASGEPSPDPLQKKIQELNQRENEGWDEDRDLTFQLDDLRKQIDTAQAVLAAIQTGAQAEMNQRTDAYAARDIQVQSRQLELDIVRSQLQSQIQNQKNTVAELQNTVSQEQAWGFESPELLENSAKLAEEQGTLSGLESQYWATQQQAGQINALQTESRAWGENQDRQQVEQSAQSQYQAQLKQVQNLTAEYDDLSDEQQKLRQSLDEVKTELQEASLKTVTG